MPPLLNHRHEKFCQIYIDNGRRGSKAYKKAFDQPDMSEPSARTLAARLLRVDTVFVRINELEGRRAEAIEQVHKVAEEYALEVVEFMMATVRDEEAPYAMRIRAGEVVLERGLGKAIQQVQVNQRVTYVIEAPAVAASFDAWAGTVEPVKLIEGELVKVEDPPAPAFDTLEERDLARGSTLEERLDDGEVWP